MARTAPGKRPAGALGRTQPKSEAPVWMVITSWPAPEALLLTWNASPSLSRAWRVLSAPRTVPEVVPFWLQMAVIIKCAPPDAKSRMLMTRMPPTGSREREPATPPNSKAFCVVVEAGCGTEPVAIEIPLKRTLMSFSGPKEAHGALQKTARGMAALESAEKRG